MLVMPGFMHAVCRLHLESDGGNFCKQLLKVVMNIHSESYHHLLNETELQKAWRPAVVRRTYRVMFY